MAKNPKTLMVEPADPEQVVRDPVTGRPLKGSTEVEDNSYWRRRLRDGSVVASGGKKAKAAPAPAAADADKDKDAKAAKK